MPCKARNRLPHQSGVENDDARYADEKAQVKIADAYFQRGRFSRILDDHNGDAAEEYTQHENAGENFADQLQQQFRPARKPARDYVDDNVGI